MKCVVKMQPSFLHEPERLPKHSLALNLSFGMRDRPWSCRKRKPHGTIPWGRWQPSVRLHLVAAYVVLLSDAPLKYENKYLFVEPNGNASTYWKREPVPGEPADKGRVPAETHTINNTKIAGAICYDYDFPYFAKALGRQGADIVALPSSDWRGIDPIHTKMAPSERSNRGIPSFGLLVLAFLLLSPHTAKWSLK
jgi:hypothetical protein